MKVVFERQLSVTGLKASLSHPVIRPDDLDAFLVGLLRLGVPRPPVDVRSRFQQLSTHLGWPATIVETDTVVAARYDFLHFVAGVVILADDRQQLVDGRAAVREHLLSARPDFSDELAGIADLWA